LLSRSLRGRKIIVMESFFFLRLFYIFIYLWVIEFWLDREIPCVLLHLLVSFSKIYSRGVRTKTHCLSMHFQDFNFLFSIYLFNYFYFPSSSLPNNTNPSPSLSLVLYLPFTRTLSLSLSFLSMLVCWWRFKDTSLCFISLFLSLSL
jgi:hypothetical protein